MNEHRKQEILIRVENHPIQSQDDDNGLIRLQRSTAKPVHSNKSSAIINAKDVDNVNFAFWRISQAQALVVNKTFARKSAQPSTYTV